jgi:hypothetical protein
MAGRRDKATADTAGRMGIFPLDRPGVRCVGVDIAAKVAGQILHAGKDSASHQVALALGKPDLDLIDASP